LLLICWWEFRTGEVPQISSTKQSKWLIWGEPHLLRLLSSLGPPRVGSILRQVRLSPCVCDRNGWPCPRSKARALHQNLSRVLQGARERCVEPIRMTKHPRYVRHTDMYYPPFCCCWLSSSSFTPHLYMLTVIDTSPSVTKPMHKATTPDDALFALVEMGTQRGRQSSPSVQRCTYLVAISVFQPLSSVVCARTVLSWRTLLTIARQ